MMEHQKENARKYFKEEVEPVFSDLITSITLDRPEDIVEYALRYFKNHNRSEC